MEHIDFQAIKDGVSVEKAARFLGLDLKQHGETFRCACPTCEQGGERAIVITPAKRAWYCFSLKKGGDVIYLVAHIKGIGQRDAALLLQDAFMRQEPEKPKRKVKTRKAPISTSSPKGKQEPAGGTEIDQWEAFIARL